MRGRRKLKVRKHNHGHMLTTPFHTSRDDAWIKEKKELIKNMVEKSVDTTTINCIEKYIYTKERWKKFKSMNFDLKKLHVLLEDEYRKLEQDIIDMESRRLILFRNRIPSSKKVFVEDRITEILSNLNNKKDEVTKLMETLKDAKK